MWKETVPIQTPKLALLITAWWSPRNLILLKRSKLFRKLVSPGAVRSRCPLSFFSYSKGVG